MKGGGGGRIMQVPLLDLWTHDSLMGLADQAVQVGAVAGDITVLCSWVLVNLMVVVTL